MASPREMSQVTDSAEPGSIPVVTTDSQDLDYRPLVAVRRWWFVLLTAMPLVSMLGAAAAFGSMHQQVKANTADVASNAKKLEVLMGYQRATLSLVCLQCVERVGRKACAADCAMLLPKR